MDVQNSSNYDTVESCNHEIDQIALPEDKEYHLFLSHSSQDEEAVIEVLNILEAPPYNLKCCIDRRDFLLGETTMANINYALNKSMGTVFFLTRNFIESDYCNHEKQAAYTMYLEGEGRVIPVILKPCCIPDEFRCIHYIDEAFPELIAEKIFKCLSIDPKDLRKQLPLHPIQAGQDRINGGHFMMKPIVPEKRNANVSLLTPHSKREFQRLGIKVTDDFQIIVKMIESLPFYMMCFHTGIKYVLLSAGLKALLLSNTITLSYCLCEGFFINPDSMPRFPTCASLIFFEPIMAVGIWLLILFSYLCFRSVSIQISEYRINAINRFSVIDQKCCFFIMETKCGEVSLSCIKYDLTDCKVFIESKYSERGDSDLAFEVVWKNIVALKIFQKYFTQLGSELLPHADDIRHQQLHDKMCFCQYFEWNGSFKHILCKTTRDRMQNFADSISDRQQLLENHCVEIDEIV